MARFAPWELVFAAGAYVDDLEAAFRANLLWLGAMGGVILAITLGLAWLINRDLTGSLTSLKAAMERLAQNELTIVIPGTNRRDEMGGMAQAVLVFKDNALAVQRLRMEQEQEHQRAETDKRAVLIAMAETIETETGASLEHMRRRTTAMMATAGAMSASAQRTGAAAETAAGAAGQAMAMRSRSPERPNSSPPRSVRSAARWASPPRWSAGRSPPEPRLVQRSRR